MSTLDIAHLVNLAGGLIVLLLSALFGRRFPSPFFKPWTLAFGLVLIFLAGEAIAHWLGRTPLLTAVGAAAMAFGGAALYQTRERLTGRPAPGWRWAAVASLASAALAAAGVTFELALLPGVLVMMAATTELGWVFTRGEPPAVSRALLLGLALMTLGLWPILYPYPLLVNTSWAWLGYSGSGALHAGVGLGMMVYLIDESWRLLRQEAERLARLKSDFVSMVSHELRTPLTSILGYAEFLIEEESEPLSPDQREYVAQIQQGATRLQRLVNDLLDYSLLEGEALKLAVKKVDVGALARQVADSLLPQAQARHQRLEVTGPAAPVWVEVDALRIEQVLLNLVGNAIKFTPEGGAVAVAIAAGPSTAHLAVTDTGPGIPAAALAHIFDKFYQVDGSSTRAHGGAGLGLAIARAIAEAHGGALEAESRPGQGATFTLSLPLATVPLASPSRELA